MVICVVKQLNLLLCCKSVMEFESVFLVTNARFCLMACDWGSLVRAGVG